MNNYHKVLNALDGYLAQEKENNEISDRMQTANERHMGERLVSDKEYAEMERELRNSEAALSYALKQVTEVVPSNVCPIGLINLYTEDKKMALALAGVV